MTAQLKLGRAIQLLRSARSLNLRELSELSGLSVPYLSLLESGDREPSLKALHAIANSLKVPFAVLLSISAPEEAGIDLDAHGRSIGEGLERLEQAEHALRKKLDKDVASSEKSSIRRRRKRDGSAS